MKRDRGYLAWGLVLGFLVTIAVLGIWVGLAWDSLWWAVVGGAFFVLGGGTILRAPDGEGHDPIE